MKRQTPLILIALALLCGIAWLLLRPRPAPPPVMLHPTAGQVDAAQKRLARLGQDAAPGTSPRTVRLSENDLNVALAGSKPLQKLLAAHSVQAVQVVLQEPDAVTIHAAATVRGQTQNVQVDGTLAPDPKTGLRFSATHAQVGSLPLPAPVVTAEASGLADHFARQFLGRLSLSVQSVSVQKKDLVIVGIPITARKPAAPPPPASPRSASPAHH